MGNGWFPGFLMAKAFDLFGCVSRDLDPTGSTSWRFTYHCDVAIAVVYHIIDVPRRPGMSSSYVSVIDLSSSE